MKSIVARAAAISAFVVCAFIPVGAADGVVMVQRVTVNGSVRTTEMKLDRTRMRTEVTDASGATTVMIFDTGKQVMDIVNMAGKSYTELTKADLERLGEQMKGSMAQLQASMAKMPPEQRARMEEMMRGRGVAMTPAKTEYRKAGTGQAGKWTCDKYEGFQNGKKVSELCTVDPRALGLTAADFAVTQDAAAFFKTAVPQGADQFLSLGKVEDQGFSGFPVRSVFTVANVQSTTELSDVRHESISDAAFAVPAGFTKQAFGRGRGPGSPSLNRP